MRRRRSRIAALFAVPLLLVSGSTLAGPATRAPAEPNPGTATAPAAGRTAPGDELPSDRGTSQSVPALKQKLEAGMGRLGEIAEEAKRDGDAVRSACAIDKQDRGRDVMEVVTGELLVIQDSGSSRQQKAFAVEKLAAAADRMQRLVEQAAGCSGDASPEDEDNVTRNEVDEPQTIPVEDPTLGGGNPVVLPPVDGVQPVSVASPSR